MVCNTNSICFVTCVNNEDAYQQCLQYLALLECPEGMAVEYCPIRGADSICAGYNQAMASSKAKYKVYLHQDLLILNPFFIYNIIEIFKNSKIGIIGLIGSHDCPDSGIWWEGKYRFGNVTETSSADPLINHIKFDSARPLRRNGTVSLLDGILLTTQYDLPWREDLFKWHFYDASQCLEFYRAGYLAEIPVRSWPWAIHHMKRPIRMDGYDAARDIFVCEYSDLIKQRENDFKKHLKTARKSYMLKVMEGLIPKVIRQRLIKAGSYE